MAPAVATTQVQVLGAVSMRAGGRTLPLSPSERQIIAVLVATGESGCTADQLADELWGDRLPRTWRSALRNGIARINSHFETPLVPHRESFRSLDLPVERVDAWHLIEGSSPPFDLLLGVPFNGVEISRSIRRMHGQVQAARRNLIRTSLEAGRRLTEQQLETIRGFVREDPYDRAAIRLAVAAYRTSTSGADALDFLRSIEQLLDAGTADDRRFFAELHATLSFDDHPIETPAQPTRRQGEAPPTERSDWPRTFPGTLAGEGDYPLFDRTSLLGQLLSNLQREETTGVILTGSQGVGKSRLAAELARALFDDGFAIAHLIASELSTAALQPFLEALPGVRKLVEPHVMALRHEPAARSRCWLAVLDYLESTAARRPLCLVIDDVHQLDELSSSLLVFLVRSIRTSRIKLIASGRPSPGSDLWATLLAQLVGAGCATAEIETLTTTDVRRHLRKTAHFDNPRLAVATAGLLVDWSGGLPGVTAALIAQLDTANPLLLPHRSARLDAGYEALTIGLDTDELEVAAAAAVVGPVVALAELVQLSEVAEAKALLVVDKLVRIAVMAETPRPDEWSFVHVLAAEAFRRSIPSARRDRLHARMLNVDADVHRLAWHAERAGGHVDPARAARYLCNSARAYFDGCNFAEAVRAFHSAIEHTSGALDLADQARLAEALERTGQSRPDLLEACVASALTLGRPTLALEAATAGLPDTEQLNGDERRLALIESVLPELLDHERRQIRAIHLSRQNLLLGRMVTARRVAREALQTARTADQRAQAWVALRHADNWWPSDESSSSDPPYWAASITVPQTAARVTEALLVGEIARGLTDSALSHIERHVTRVRQDRDPLATWYALLIWATVQTDLGHEPQAAEARASAEELGNRFGLTNAEPAASGQAFFSSYLCGDHARYAEFLDSFVAAEPDNLLAGAAYALALEAAGEPTQAAQHARGLAARAVSSRFAEAVFGLLADLLGADRELSGEARRRLEGRRGGYLTVGVGFANLGPTPRLLAKLAPDRLTRRALLQEAIDLVDQAITPLWQVMCRLDLAMEMERPHQVEGLVRQARRRATTPWLDQLIDAHPVSSG